ncbi:uncharacterized protein [Argopecten irradians]|uniref:uncharacterized protein n=1 Tax=Argopecten irradians TaxID=31199 RepID=UPI003721723A
MERYTLTAVLQSLEYPTTVRIVKGSVTSEEGKCFSDKDNNVLTLYSRGIRVYVPPVTNASLRRRCREAKESERMRRKSADDIGDEYVNTENLFTKNIFVSAKTKLKDNHFAGKEYTNAGDILTDLPYAVRANKPIFICADDNHVRVISKNEVLYVDRVNVKDYENMKALSVRVNDDHVSIPVTSQTVFVTAVPNPNAEVLAAEMVLYKDKTTRPKEMVFEDEDVQETYEVEVGFNVLPLSEQPLLSVCCVSGEAATLIDDIDDGMLRIQKVWCLHYRAELMDRIKVEVIDTDIKPAFKAEIGKEVGRDPDGFSRYNLYGKSPDYLKPVTRRSQSVDLPAKVPDRTPPPLPTRSRVGSVTLRQMPVAPLPPRGMLSIAPPLRTKTATDKTSDPQVQAGSVMNSTELPNTTDDVKISELDAVTIDQMRISDLANMLRMYKLERVARLCEDHLVDGTILLALNEHDLREEPFYLNGLELKKVVLLKKGHRPK